MKKRRETVFKVSCGRKEAFGLRHVHPQETASTLIKWGVLCEHRCILFSYEGKMIKLSETKIKNQGFLDILLFPPLCLTYSYCLAKVLTPSL